MSALVIPTIDTATVSIDRITPNQITPNAKPSFFELLNARAKTTLLCVGLDPRAHTPSEALNECKRLIIQTQEFAAAYKPNAAFFERFGPEGWNVLREVIASIPPHIPCILDAKRGDIASTADAYASSAFQFLNAHAITASPYMGHDSLESFIRHREKGVFVLCKTSNKGSNDLQCLPIKGENGKMLYEVVAEKAATSWSAKYDNVGLVVGATDPQALASVRARAPTLWFLVPGIGAQGGSLEASLKAGLRPMDKSGMLINVSRAIAGAKDPRAEAEKLVDQINDIRYGKSPKAYDSQRNPKELEALASGLVVSKSVRFGEFKLKSGRISPIYIDLRRLITHPPVMKMVAKEYAKVLKKYNFDRIAGLPYAALPIATAISLEMHVPLIYPRKETKSYGTKVAIEGEYKAGDKIVIIDDLVSTGETKVEAIEKLKAAGLDIVAIVVLIDREMGAKTFLNNMGYEFEAVAGLYELLPLWERSRAISLVEAAKVRQFLSQWNPNRPKL